MGTRGERASCPPRGQMMPGAPGRKRATPGLQGPSSPNFWGSSYHLDMLYGDKGKEKGEIACRT